ncbi:DNA-protecting protein DprA [Candidatus Saccharibacteria bacterium]|nr:DNA-protecting protein DprA [Candidatus Saccharibacteria bacterium]
MFEELTEKDYWFLWNQLYEAIGPTHFDQLLRAFGSAEKAWEASAGEFKRLGWGPKALEKLENRENLTVTAIKDISSIYSCGLITRSDTGYPENLLQINSPPPILYSRGELLPRDRVALAVVGSRKMTSYGHQVVDALVPELATAGLTIVSGLALGVDTAAHKAALLAGGRTIAVLLCGINTIYPPSNQQLANEIVKSGKGVLVTEFPPDTPAYQSNFPFRNRIISGLSLAVLVVEAAEGSGTFHTVSAALEQGKDVFAVPGSIFSPFSAGTAKLIERGAKPATRALDILEELEVAVENFRQAARETIPPDPEEKRILELMGADELHIDELVRRSKLNTAKISSLLTVMEMKDLVRHLGGGIYQASIQL